jgi:hypothetical protein
MSSQRVSKDKLLWSSDPEDLAIAPFLVVDGSHEIDHKLIGTDPDADLYRSRSKLPSRIVIIDNDASQRASNAPFPPVLRVGGLRVPKRDAGQRDQETFILTLYDRWIENLIKRRGLCGNQPRIGVSIYFEDQSKAEAWEEAFKNNCPPWASELKFPKSRPKTPYSDLSDVNVWRHIELEEVLEEEGKSPPLFYEMTSYHNAFFSFLYAVDPKADRNREPTGPPSGGSPPSFHAQYLLRQLVESALLRVLVIDDRVAGTIWGRQDKDGKLKDLRYMGIFIARKITVDGQKEPIILAGDQQESARGWVNLHLQEDGSIKSIEIDNGEDSAPTPAEFDVLFIHQTIFENKIAPSRKERWQKNEWVRKCKRKIPYVIFHSGRGKQPELLPENAAFLEYSALQEHLLQEPSKFLLTQIALSAKG